MRPSTLIRQAGLPRRSDTFSEPGDTGTGLQAGLDLFRCLPFVDAELADRLAVLADVLILAHGFRFLAVECLVASGIADLFPYPRFEVEGAALPSEPGGLCDVLVCECAGVAGFFYEEVAPHVVDVFDYEVTVEYGSSASAAWPSRGCGDAAEFEYPFEVSGGEDGEIGVPGRGRRVSRCSEVELDWDWPSVGVVVVEGHYPRFGVGCPEGEGEVGCPGWDLGCALDELA